MNECNHRWQDWSMFLFCFSLENGNGFWSQHLVCNTYCRCDKEIYFLQDMDCYVKPVQLAREFSCDWWNKSSFWRLSDTFCMLFPAWNCLRSTNMTLVVNEACIEETYFDTSITSHVIDYWSNDFHFSICTLDIYPTRCMFLENFSDFKNCTSPFVSITSNIYPL